MSDNGSEMQRFLNIEKKYNLYEAEVCGVNFWNYARVTIWNREICADKLNLHQDHRKPACSRKKKIRSAIFLINHFMTRGKHLREPVEILILSHNRRVKNGSCYECIYSEELTRHFKSLTVERLYDYDYLGSIANPDILYSDVIAWRGSVSYLLHKALRTPKYKNIRDNVRKQTDKPLQEIRAEFTCDLNTEEILQFLIKIVFSSCIERKPIEKIICKVRPKMIVEVVNYGMQKMIANELGRQYGIPTVELQHGTMHSEHAGYQYADGAVVKQLPDYMFLFSEFWKDQIHLPIPEENLRVTGFPYFEKQMSIYRQHAVREDDRQTILFVSQGTIGEELSHVAAELVQILPKEKYRLLYKLHPGEYAGWKETYPRLADSAIPVYDTSETGIYELFAVSDIQVGVYSTAIYEGLGFGLRTFILEVGHWKTMEELISGGYAQSFRDASELMSFLETEKGYDSLSGKIFWKENATEHMITEIKNIMECYECV